MRLVLAVAAAGPLAAWPAAPAATPEMVAIPPGAFPMGDAKGAGWERPVRVVRLPAFEISARPVTNAQYRAFRPSHRSSADDADTAPVTDVSWSEANEYCAWLSKRLGRSVTLPTEAWWERAARGGLDGRRYPWGDEPAPSGERPNAYGFSALAWNLWEWAADWYSADAYTTGATVDPRGPAEGLYRALRGGGYKSDPASATVFNRGSARPGTASERITFRVASPLAGEPPPAVSQASPPPAAPGPAAGPAPVPPPSPRPPPSTPPRAAGSSSVTAIEFDAGSARTLVVRVDGPSTHKSFVLNEPERLVVDIAGAAPGRGLRAPAPPAGSSPVRGVRFAQFQAEPPVFRLVVDLEAAANHRTETVEGGLRIVVSPR